MKLIPLLLAFALGGTMGAQTQTRTSPDCLLNFTFTSAVPGSPLNNVPQVASGSSTGGCVFWTVTVDQFNTGAGTIVFQSNPSSTTTGTAAPVTGWVTFSPLSGTTSLGSNPTSTFPWTYATTGYAPWVRVNVTSYTSGTLRGSIQGWRRISSAGGGGGGGTPGGSNGDIQFNNSGSFGGETLVPIANGGTGTATPSLVPGTNVTITGSWPNQTINSSGGGGGAGGGFTTYSSGTATVTLPAAGTTFFPAGGGGPPNSTEANVQSASPAATISKFYVHLSANIGTGNTIAFTFRDGGSDQSVTCTISGAANTCNDTTHSVTVAAGDIISIKAVTTGTVVITPQIVILFSTGGGGGGGLSAKIPYLSDGSNSYAAISAPASTIPGSFTFSWVNQASVTETLSNGAAQWLISSFGGGGPFITARTAPLTASSNYTASACFVSFSNGNFSNDIILTDGTQFITFGLSMPLTGIREYSLSVIRWSNFSTVASSPFAIDNFTPQGGPVCLRITDDGTNLVYELGLFVGTQQWMVLFSESRSAFLTATSWGYGINYNPNITTTGNAQVIFLSATQVTP